MSKAKRKKAKGAAPSRPRPLTHADLESLCTHVGTGRSLRSWAADNNRDPAVIVRWLQADRARQDTYREARRMQADWHIDELIELADAPVPCDDTGKTDTGLVNDKRLRIDTRKWIASKYHPAMYGDRVDVTATMVPGRERKPDEVMAEMIAFLAAHGLTLSSIK